MTFWIARGKDNILILFKNEPELEDGEWCSHGEMCRLEVGDDLFPQVTFEKPQKIEINLCEN
jgi:hypothetical protein